jgi:cbb3-type cytochrome oxidase subunit 1
LTKSLLSKFVIAGMFYFLVGTFWMATHRSLPAPTQTFARTIFSTTWVHLLTVGWLSLLGMGVIYYLVPSATGKQLFSERLGNIHFWATNAALVLSFIVANVLAFSIDPLLARQVPIPQAILQVMPLPIIFDILNYFGWAVQLLFVYNIGRTLAKK